MGIAIAGRKEQEQWQAESDMRTLMEASAIRRDPKRLKAAQAAAKKRLVEMSAVVAATGADPDVDGD